MEKGEEGDPEKNLRKSSTDSKSSALYAQKKRGY